MFLLKELLPLGKLGPLNLQNPELWGQEAQLLPGVMVRVTPLLLSPLGSWTHVFYLLDTKHCVVVCDLEYSASWRMAPHSHRVFSEPVPYCTFNR